MSKASVLRYYLGKNRRDMSLRFIWKQMEAEGIEELEIGFGEDGEIVFWRWESTP